MALTIFRQDGHNSGNSKRAGLPEPSIKLANRAADVIYARSRLLNSDEMRSRMDALALACQTAGVPGHTFADFMRFDAEVRRLQRDTDGLFDEPKLRDLAERWEMIKDYLDDCPDWAGVFCGVGSSEPSGFELRLHHTGATEMLQVDDRRHAGKGPHHRNQETIDRAVLSLRHRLRTGYASASDDAAANECNVGWKPGDFWIEPLLIKRDRQKLRELVTALG